MYFSPKNKKLKESFSHCPDNYLILLPSFLPIYIPNSIPSSVQKLFSEDILGESDTTVVNCQCQRPKRSKKLGEQQQQGLTISSFDYKDQLCVCVLLILGSNITLQTSTEFPWEAQKGEM